MKVKKKRNEDGWVVLSWFHMMKCGDSKLKAKTMPCMGGEHQTPQKPAKDN